ncbi:hypothetical protein ABEF95_001268 [Exophiala dermatitidis]
MAPSTGSSNRDRRSTPPYQTIQIVKPLQAEGSRRPGEEWDTIRRTRFYTAYDRRPEDESLRAFSRRLNMSVSTACHWLKKREQLGTAAYRRTRPLVKDNGGHLGRPPKLAQETVEMLLSPSRNPVRREPLRKQIAFHGLEVSKRTLQRRLKQGKRERLSRIRKEAARRRKERLEEERKKEGNEAIQWKTGTQQEGLQTETPLVLQSENKEEAP